MSGGDYRDELAAAHARIAELEEELADEKYGATGDAAPWLRDLEATRAAIVANNKRGLADPKYRWKVRGVIVAVALVLASVLAVVTASWIPFLAFGLFTLHPGMLFVWILGRNAQQAAKRELAKIDETIADTQRMARMMGAARPRARVASPAPLLEEDASVAPGAAQRRR